MHCHWKQTFLEATFELSDWIAFFKCCNIIHSSRCSKGSINKTTFMITCSLNIYAICLIVTRKIRLRIACLTSWRHFNLSKKSSKHATNPFIAPWELNWFKTWATSSNSFVVLGNFHAKALESCKNAARLSTVPYVKIAAALAISEDNIVAGALSVVHLGITSLAWTRGFMIEHNFKNKL